MTPEETSNKKQETNNFWRELLELVLIAVIVIIPFRLFIAKPFVVDGLSMHPTFDNGDYLIIDEVSYRLREPRRGEVIVFTYPKETCPSFAMQVYTLIRTRNWPSCRHFIKRVVGLPSETIKISSGQVTIFSNSHSQGLALDEPYVERDKKEDQSFTLGEDEYFVMGDNRRDSFDSRSWGAVPRSRIVGRPIFQALPPELLPGDISKFKE